MIEWVMFGALGFFLGCLLALMLASPLWNRAVKLTTKKLEATMPMSLTDIQADKDQQRAEYAIAIRKVEVQLEKAKEKATRELIEANKRRVEIQVLNNEIAAAKAEIQEKDNANRVLQQTIKRRLPDLDSRLKAAKNALTELETINSELRNTLASQSDALKIARTTLHTQRVDIDRLRTALEAGGGSMRGSRADSRYLAESQRLSAELSRAQEELSHAQVNAHENALLRSEMTKLASQILAVTRSQGIHPRAVAEAAGVFAETSRHEREASREPRVETEVEIESVRVEMSEDRVEVEETEISIEESDVPAEPQVDEMMPEAVSEEAGPEEAGQDDSVSDETVPAEAEETTTDEAAKRSSRRERRRARKGRGKSLGERLRGLVTTETHETPT
ncbi:MAG: hypothetical protein FJX44_02905 [Alphaproteobacteria bacterium]|nr:hypothetical protein [Alphaproteobacteria bacterium]